MSTEQTFFRHDNIDTLYSQHNRWLIGWLAKKVGCPHNAADLAQDTFVRIIKSRNALLGVREPRAYLITTAKRLMIDKARRRTLETAYLNELMVAAETLESYPSPEQTLQAIEALQHISQVLERVPAKAQQVFLLVYLEGKTQTATAEQLGITTRTVRSHLLKVLVSCQQHIDF